MDAQEDLRRITMMTSTAYYDGNNRSLGESDVPHTAVALHRGKVGDIAERVGEAGDRFRRAGAGRLHDPPNPGAKVAVGHQHATLDQPSDRIAAARAIPALGSPPERLLQLRLGGEELQTGAKYPIGRDDRIVTLKEHLL